MPKRTSARADGPKGGGQDARSQTGVGARNARLVGTSEYGEVAERFKAPVLTRRQDAEANIGASRWPEGRRAGGPESNRRRGAQCAPGWGTKKVRWPSGLRHRS